MPNICQTNLSVLKHSKTNAQKCIQILIYVRFCRFKVIGNNKECISNTEDHHQSKVNFKNRHVLFAKNFTSPENIEKLKTTFVEIEVF